MVDFILAGLGNPGELYQNTPHNIGFDVIEAWAAFYGLTWTEDKKRKAWVATLKIAGKALIGVKPYSYMNNSGDPLQGLCSYYKCPPEQVIVISDEIDLPFMEVKIRNGGGAGGHNGLRDILAKVGKNVLHYRVGVGPKPFASMPLEHYVLHPMSPQQRELRKEKMTKVIYGLQLLVDKGPEFAMNLMHQRST